MKAARPKALRLVLAATFLPVSGCISHRPIVSTRNVSHVREERLRHIWGEFGPRIAEIFTHGLKTSAGEEQPFQAEFLDNRSYRQRVEKMGDTFDLTRSCSVYQVSQNRVLFSNEGNFEEKATHETIHALDDILVISTENGKETGRFTLLIWDALSEHIQGRRERLNFWQGFASRYNPREQAKIQPHEFFAYEFTRFLRSPDKLKKEDPALFHAFSVFDDLVKKGKEAPEIAHAFRLALANELQIGGVRFVIEGNPLPQAQEGLESALALVAPLLPLRSEGELPYRISLRKPDSKILHIVWTRAESSYFDGVIYVPRNLRKEAEFLPILLFAVLDEMAATEQGRKLLSQMESEIKETDTPVKVFLVKAWSSYLLDAKRLKAKNPRLFNVIRTLDQDLRRSP